MARVLPVDNWLDRKRAYKWLDGKKASEYSFGYIFLKALNFTIKFPEDLWSGKVKLKLQAVQHID